MGDGRYGQAHLKTLPFRNFVGGRSKCIAVFPQVRFSQLSAFHFTLPPPLLMDLQHFTSFWSFLVFLFGILAVSRRDFPAAMSAAACEELP